MDKNREISLMNIAFDLKQRSQYLIALQESTATFQKDKINKWWSLIDKKNDQLRELRICALLMIDAEVSSCQALATSIDLLAQQITKVFLEESRKTQAIIDMLIMDTNHLTFKQ